MHRNCLTEHDFRRLYFGQQVKFSADPNQTAMAP
jgi:hypothetical protein